MFRIGGQNSRSQTLDTKEQSIALNSIQEHVVKPCKIYWNTCVVCDVICKKRKKVARRLLSNINNSLHIRIREAPIGSQTQGFRDSIDWALNETGCDKVFIVRVDLQFKQRIPVENIRIKLNPVLVPWQMSAFFGFGAYLSSGRPRVCDTFMFINKPWVVVDALTTVNDMTLHSIMDWVDSCGFIIDGYRRDSDSFKESNDYYRIIGRAEGIGYMRVAIVISVVTLLALVVLSYI